MARDKGISPRSVKVEDTKEPSTTVTGTGKDYGKAAVAKVTGADDPKIGGQLMPGSKYSPRGNDSAGVQSVGDPDGCIADALKTGETDF